MKKQTITGWAYPCEEIISKRTSSSNVDLIHITEDLYCSMEDALADKEDEGCPCGKGCEPIEIRITVEKLDGK
jgi:hypothetical protein